METHRVAARCVFFYLIAEIIEQDDDLLLIPNDLLLTNKVFQNSITDGRKEEKEKRGKQNTNTKGQTENDADHTEKNGNNTEYTEKRGPLFHARHFLYMRHGRRITTYGRGG
jgi:hypothetical protein